MHNRNISVYTTLGPASLNPQTLNRLRDRGVALLRINLSHTALDDVAPIVKLIREHVDLPICLDTEGAQVRTGPMAVETRLEDRTTIELTADVIEGSSAKLALTPRSVFETLRPGHIISLDFDGAAIEVTAASAAGATAVVLNPGRVGSNKAALVDPPTVLPPLSEKDIAAVKLGRSLGLRHFALSFANREEDVHALRELTGPDSHIISKIESVSGVQNLDSILVATDEILIDRGDLSSQVPLVSIPFLQKAIIKKATVAGVPVAVATNLLESMLTNRRPTRAEINDIVNTLMDGASALVLAAETAIGDHPVASVDMTMSLIERFTQSLDGHRVDDLLLGGSIMLPAFHGKKRAAARPDSPDRFLDPTIADQVAGLQVDERTELDLHQLSAGVYSPLDGFMTSVELDHVLQEYRLPSGDAWTMPLLFQGSAERFASVGAGQTIRLENQHGVPVALMYVAEKYTLSQDAVAASWFGTTDPSHPGVQRFLAAGDHALAGPVKMLDAPDNSIPFALTPAQTRKVFAIKGWSHVVGFHTRNVPHRGHEYLINHAIDRSNADGILIHPVAGPKRPGDFRREIIFGTYEILVQSKIDAALLAAFRTYSRFAGPREAVFTALCRKNFGCSHFVMGRDHTGTGDFYAPDANRDLFDHLGDIGISPVFFDTVAYSPAAGGTIEVQDGMNQDDYSAISGSFVRDLLAAGESVPEWCMSPEISTFILGEQAAGRPLFEE